MAKRNLTISFDTDTIRVPVLGDSTLEVDLGKISPKGLKVVFEYGLGRKLRDGNAPQKFYGYTEKGDFVPTSADGKTRLPAGAKPIERPQADREREAVALSEATLAQLYDGSIGDPRTGGRISPELRWARVFVMDALVRRGGLKPSAVPAMPTMEAVRAIVGKVKGLKWEEVEKFIAESMSKESDVTLDVTALLAD